VKLEIHPARAISCPIRSKRLAAAEILVKKDLSSCPTSTPILFWRNVADVGTGTVMPLGSPIGSNRGIETRAQIEIIIEQATVPVVVDAGLGRRASG